MTTRTKVIALLALPAGIAGYLVTGMILSGLDLPDGLSGLLLIFVPLLVAGLCMLPFLLPLVDAMAKRDLAAIEAEKARGAAGGTTGGAPKPPAR
jgi:hypothetical protein